MSLLIMLLAMVLWRWTPLAHYLQKDHWLLLFLGAIKPKAGRYAIHLALLIPASLLAIGLWFLKDFSGLLNAIVTLLVLMYSFGRGDWSIQVESLKAAWRSDDAERGLKLIKQWQPAIEIDEKMDWKISAMRAIAYHGFERSFPVIFWFLVLGPVGALVYRLGVVLAHSDKVTESELRSAKHWLWLTEWLPLRVLGFSFALTGNFMGCIEHWRACALCGVRSTSAVLSHYIQGALQLPSVTDEETALACQEGFCDVLIDIRIIASLYSRTLLFWVCIILIVGVAI